MLRPGNSLLDSSRSARRASFRADQMRAVTRLFRAVKGLVSGLLSLVLELVLLWCLPFAYLTATYFVLDLPARWLAHRPLFGRWGMVVFLAALAICFTGVMRAVQNAEPIAPVRPRFAKALFGLSWVLALILTIGDLAG